MRSCLPASLVLLLTLCSICCLAPAADAGPQLNRLAVEKSPYLRQHAANPVDWYPWGPEAFAKARKENKPIFLSIGYATCHWCHVMERESFSNPDLAALLNESFVAVKVDREERPDVDRVYMTFVQASTGGGGWPLTVWLTPELKPFFGGTYFPPESRDGSPGLKSLLIRLRDLWANDRAHVEESAAAAIAALAEEASPARTAEALSTPSLRRRALVELATSFDAEAGGFDRAPKFPQPSVLALLADVTVTTRDAAEREQTRHMLGVTLDGMARGAIHDQLGGGFHRYATDRAWRVPHFEKMLSDQAQLAVAYLAGWQISREAAFRSAAMDTLEYVRRDLTAEAGGFFSAEDADSSPSVGDGQKTEGAFYLWSLDEVRKAAPLDAPVLECCFGLSAGGNAGPDFAGRNVLYRALTTKDAAARLKLPEGAAVAALARSTNQLEAVRAKRPRPARNEQILTGWNGLTISAFARAAQVLEEPAYAAVAERAAGFARRELFDPATGRLAHSRHDGKRDSTAFAEDYAFLIAGLLDLYEATFDVQWLRWAAQLQQTQIDLFADANGGGFYANTREDKTVILRLKEDVDGAEPSPNSIAVRNLARLAAMLHRDDWKALAAATGRAFQAQFERSPTALPQMIAALGWLEGTPQQIVIAGEPGPVTGALVHEVWSRFLPHRVLLRVDERSRPFLGGALEVVASFPPNEPGVATGYVCENFACQQPTRDPGVLARQLSRK